MLTRVRHAFFVATCLLLGSFPALGQVTIKPIELTPSSYFLLLKRDATEIVSAPLRWEKSTWKKVSIGVGSVAVLMLIDDKVRDEMLRYSDETTSRISDAVEPFGSDYSWVVLAGFYGAGKLFQNSRAAAVAEDGVTSSLIAAGLITPALKALAGRSRPSQSKDDYEFLDHGGSFPSGHATQAFAVAAVIAEHYDSIWIDVLAYGLAGLVGYARIEHHAHFFSDVLTGAAIGVAVGKSVVRLNGEHRRISLKPMVTGDGGAGLSLRLDLSRLSRRNALKEDR